MELPFLVVLSWNSGPRWGGLPKTTVLLFLITNLLFFLYHTVCLRIQINPQNKGEFQGISPERAFADFLFANTILHLVVINFVG